MAQALYADVVRRAAVLIAIRRILFFLRKWLRNLQVVHFRFHYRNDLRFQHSHYSL